MYNLIQFATILGQGPPSFTKRFRQKEGRLNTNYHVFGLRNLVIQKSFLTKSHTSVVARVFLGVKIGFGTIERRRYLAGCCASERL